MQAAVETDGDLPVSCIQKAPSLSNQLPVKLVEKQT